MSGFTRPRLAAVLLVALVASGCSGSGSGDVTAGGGGSTTTTVAVEETSSTTTAPTTTTTTEPPTTTTTTAPVDPTTIPEPEGPLRSGSVGTRTKAIQEALTAQHYDLGEADGKFGLNTTMAVWAFQQLHGLAPDGVVGPETRRSSWPTPSRRCCGPTSAPPTRRST